METIFSNVRGKDIKLEPFAHIAKENVISTELCDRLIEEFPAMETITQGQPCANNQRFSYCAAEILKENKVSPLWHNFISAHLTKVFFNFFVNLFGDHIRKVYPRFERGLKPLSELKIGIRNIDSFDKVDVALDAQICVNTPVTEKSSVKIAHLDNEHEFFAGLLYLRREEDDSRGGDLEIFEYKKQPKFHGPRLIADKFVKQVSSFPYQRNGLVFFLNSMDAVHGVSPREITSHPRIFVNILGEVAKPLFDLKPLRENFFDKVLRHL